MRYEIEPFVGAGDLRLGATAAEMAAVLGPPDEQETNEDGLSQESWFDKGVSVVYDGDGTAEDITVFEPSELVFRGYELLDLTEPEACEFLANIDAEATRGEGWAMSEEFGIGVQFAEPDEGADPDTPAKVDMASIFTKSAMARD